MGLKHRRATAAVMTALLMPLVLVDALSADELEAIRRSVEGKSAAAEQPHDRPRKRRRHRDDCDDDHGFTSFVLEEVFGPPLLFTLTLPWWGPAKLVGDDYSTVADFPHSPYADGRDGYLDLAITSEPDFRPVGIRFTSEYATDFGDIERVGGRLQLDSVSRFGLDTEWNWWREDFGSSDDSLWTGDANLTFRFAQSEEAQFYTGLGVNWLGGDDSEVGFNFTYGVDWFPAKPLVVRSVLDAGTLGDAGLLHNKTTLGIVHRNVELFTGFDVLQIGGTTLHGLIGGFTIWY